jgi:hypothetical protein
VQSQAWSKCCRHQPSRGERKKGSVTSNLPGAHAAPCPIPVAGAAPAPGILPCLSERSQHDSGPWPSGSSSPQSQAAGSHQGTTTQSPLPLSPWPTLQCSFLVTEWRWHQLQLPCLDKGSFLDKCDHPTGLSKRLLQEPWWHEGDRMKLCLEQVIQTSNILNTGAVVG